MKKLLDYLEYTFETNFNASITNMCETATIVDRYHGKVWTDEQLQVLKDRGQPEEQFNVIAMFAHQLLGYYSNVISDTKALPRTPEDTDKANLLNSIRDFDNESSNWHSEGNELKLYGMLTGVSVARVRPVTVKVDGEDISTDAIGREHIYVKKEYVPWDEYVLDATSIKADYSDANFIHVMNWMTKADVISTFGKERIYKVTDDSDVFSTPASTMGYSRYNEFDSSKWNNAGKYLVIHSTLKDIDGRRWSIYWSKGTIFKRIEIDKGTVGEYKVTKIMNDKQEHYSIFRSILPSVTAIDQALIQIHMLINSNKILWSEGGIDPANKGVEKFMNSISRVNSLTKVLDLNKIKMVNLSGDVVKQYTIIDRALQRIQLMLGVNDSFLGVAYASDSGAKVNLQKGATIMALDYLTQRFLLMYKSVGEEEFRIIQRYMIAERHIRVEDNSTIEGYRWASINTPLRDEKGTPVAKLHKEDRLFLNINTTDIITANVDYVTKATSYINETQANQAMLETVANGMLGNFLMNADPAKFSILAEEAIKGLGTKSAPKVAQLFRDLSTEISDPNNPAGVDPASIPQLGGQPSNSQNLPVQGNPKNIEG